MLLNSAGVFLSSPLFVESNFSVPCKIRNFLMWVMYVVWSVQTRYPFSCVILFTGMLRSWEGKELLVCFSNSRQHWEHIYTLMYLVEHSMNLACVMEGGKFIASLTLRTYALRQYTLASEHGRCVITSAVWAKQCVLSHLLLVIECGWS